MRWPPSLQTKPLCRHRSAIIFGYILFTYCLTDEFVEMVFIVTKNYVINNFRHFCRGCCCCSCGGGGGGSCSGGCGGGGGSSCWWDVA